MKLLDHQVDVKILETKMLLKRLMCCSIVSYIRCSAAEVGVKRAGSFAATLGRKKRLGRHPVFAQTLVDCWKGNWSAGFLASIWGIECRGIRGNLYRLGNNLGPLGAEKTLIPASCEPDWKPYLERKDHKLICVIESQCAIPSKSTYLNSCMEDQEKLRIWIQEIQNFSDRKGIFWFYIGQIPWLYSTEPTEDKKTVINFMNPRV